MKRHKTSTLLAALALGLGGLPAVAQTPTPTAQTGKKVTVSTRVNPVVVENADMAPQIVTVLHRLTGLKVIRQLLRYNEELGAIANLDEAFKITRDVHTNVIAGLALDDGETIAAWLPEAAAEMPPPSVHYFPRAPVMPRTPEAAGMPSQPQAPGAPPMPLVGVPSIPFAGMVEPADLKVITRDGKRLAGRYIGLDGLTGLSLIALTNSGLPRIVEAKNESIVIGQRLRVVGPEPAPRPDSGAAKTMYFRVGRTEAVVTNVDRSPSGALARIKVKAPKLSAASMGSIAINDAGETVGIIDSVQGSEASIVPVAMIKSAAKRVIARQASVPRPWLGIRGEPIGTVSLEKFQGVGWKLDRARELAEKRSGILLTSVIPGSPAALKKLKPGDVILTVNNEDIRNGEEFTWLLQEAGPGNDVKFTVARPGQPVAEAFEIQLSESPDPFVGRRMSVGQQFKLLEPASLMAHGVETIAIKPKVATRFGASGGLLVVYVQPASEAFKAGLRPGDVIESIDGEQLVSGTRTVLLKHPGASSTFNVVRNKQKLTVTISTSKHNAE